jgi:hypothetical protein
MYEMNIYKRVCDQFLLGMQLSILRRETATTHNLKATTVYATPDPRSCEPYHTSKMWHQSASSNSANSNIASVRYGTEVMGVWRHCRNWHLWKTGRWWRVVEKWVHCSTFVRCVRFFGFNSFLPRTVVLIAAGREVITLTCCFKWQAWYWFAVSCHLWSVTSMAVANHARQNNQYTR